ncbi:MAG: DEAD/DEAH box helicase family protein, partial [Nitrososphaeraceae archaeon]
LNHAIGLPHKNGHSYPLFDYEKLVFDTLQNHKHVWIKKATGLGITEFMLRYIAWLCLSTNKIENSQMCIVTGPRIELAITLIDRMKGLFHELGVTFDSKDTVIELNGCHIEAYPSHHLDSMRGLTNVSFIYLDEADFFPPGQQQDARDVSERYIAKSNPWIVMVSTPNAPDGLFDKIERESEETCLYKRMFLDYTYGLDRIYTSEEIALAKQSPSFEREYNLKYFGTGRQRISHFGYRSSHMHAAGRPGNDGLVHEYHDKKKHGYRRSLGRHIKVCHCYYPM